MSAMTNNKPLPIAHIRCDVNAMYMKGWIVRRGCQLWIVGFENLSYSLWVIHELALTVMNTSVFFLQNELIIV